MHFKPFFKRLLFCFSFTLFSSIIVFFLFYPLYTASHVIIPYSLHPYDISVTYPTAWFYLKLFFIPVHLISSFLISHWIFTFFSSFFKKSPSSISCSLPIEISTPNSSLSLLVGLFDNHDPIYLSEKSLYQNILITGTIGTGKTSSAMYPFTRQLIQYHSSSDKMGMLILDVKGNFYQQVLSFAKSCHRLSDVYVIQLGGSITYNPLDKPHLKPSVLANRLKTILTLFSPTTSDSYWLDKVEETLSACITYCRLYHNGYVTFSELHSLITLPHYYLDKLNIVKEQFFLGKFSPKDCYDILSSLQFLEKEFFALDERTRSIIKSEITRITNCFVSDYDVLHTFCPKKQDISFSGFQSVIEQGKIVVLNMNIAEYRNLSKIIATYLKLDFQTEVLRFLSHSSCPPRIAFICDEYHEYCTASDADFFSQSREANCINIVATQSYSSLFHAISNPYTVKVILQNLVNKFWFRTDDITTIEDIQKQLGKEDKPKYSKTISENAKETNYSYVTHSFHSHNANLSESLNEYTQTDYIYDTHFFTQQLETFSCLAFLSDGYHIVPPMKLSLFPYFKSYPKLL